MHASFICIKLGREAVRSGFPALSGELGKRHFRQRSKEAWKSWIGLQTMLVNENRLNLADIKARKYLAEQMEAISSARAPMPLPALCQRGKQITATQSVHKIRYI